MKITETARVSDELCRLLLKEEEEFRYKACTGQYSFLKHANS